MTPFSPTPRAQRPSARHGREVTGHVMPHLPSPPPPVRRRSSQPLEVSPAPINTPDLSSSFCGVQIGPPLEEWRRKSAGCLGDIKEMGEIRRTAGQEPASRAYPLLIIGSHLSTCLRSTSDPTSQRWLQRQSQATGLVRDRIALLKTAIAGQREDGPRMAQALLEWTVAELLESLSEPPMSADLMVLGLREGVSAAELIGLHRAGLTIDAVRRVRKACEANQRPAPSLREVAIYGPAGSLSREFLAWGMQHGFEKDDLAAIAQAGWTEDAADLPPVPGTTSRHMTALKPTGRTLADGWIELDDTTRSKPAKHYRFKVCDRGSPTVQRLHLGLFVQALAGLLDLQERVLPVHAHVQHIDGQPVYGVLVGPWPAESARPSKRPPEEGQGSQQQELERDWLAHLADVGWPTTETIWSDTPPGGRLSLGLPDAPPGKGSDDEPLRFVGLGHPATVPQALGQRLQGLTLESLQPALRWLTPEQERAFAQRWHNMDLDSVRLLPPPRRPLRKITRLGTARPTQTPPNTARRARSWQERVKDLQPSANTDLSQTAQRLDRLERQQTASQGEPMATRLVVWGQLQRTRADLASLLARWTPAQDLPAPERAAAQRQQQVLGLKLRGMSVASRRMPDMAQLQGSTAGIDPDLLQVLTSSLKTYDHLLVQSEPDASGPKTGTASHSQDAELTQSLLQASLRIHNHLAKLAGQFDEVRQTRPEWLIRLQGQINADIRGWGAALDLIAEADRWGAGSQPHRSTPHEWLQAASLPDLTASQRQVAWRAGATPADLVRMHTHPPESGLRPTWPLLAQSLLRAQAQALLEESDPRTPPDPRQISEMQRQLQGVYPLSEIARAALYVLPAVTPPTDQTSQQDPTANPVADIATDTATALPPALGAVNAANQTYQQALQTLESTPLTDAALVQRTQLAQTALASLEDQLFALHQDEQTPDVIRTWIEETAQDRYHGEKTALERLPATALTLTSHPVPGPQSPLLAGHLLPWLEPDGPDDRRLLHGLLAGWNLNDTGWAHADGLPAWAMDLHPEPHRARAVHQNDDLRQAMRDLQHQLVLPQRD